MHVKKALTKGWTQGTIIFYHEAQNDSFVIFLQITANLTLINSIQTKFSSFRQHMQTSIKKEDSSTQPLIVLPDKHHAKNVLTSITLDTRYGRVLFTLIFSAFSCKRDDCIEQNFQFLKEQWCWVGRRVKHEHLVLSNAFIKVELSLWKLWKADIEL